jgi:signal transduction histidine kinase
VLRQVVLAAAATIAGLGLILYPWVGGLLRDLGEERRERIRSEERAEVAAHVHDSVLQTLALIQRNADKPRELVALARRQERELRSWLYGDRARDAGATLASEMSAMAVEVEERHDIEVDVVTVGDCPLDAHVNALVQSAREAAVNAAKHSGATEVSVYVEVEPDKVSVFVRDRGKGFDPSVVPAHRKGISESIEARMARHGGTTQVTSSDGEGTEVALEIPLERRA